MPPTPLTPHNQPRWRRYINRYHEQYRRNARLLVYGRLVLIAIFTTALLLSSGSFPSFTPPVFIVLGLFLAMTVTYVGVFRYVRNLERFVLIQIITDVVAETLLIYLTGGVLHVSFTLFYFVSVVTVAMLISERASLICASLCSVSLAATAVLYFMAFKGLLHIPYVSPEMVDFIASQWSAVVKNLIEIAIALHVVALLAGNLPHRVTGVRILYEEILSQLREGVLAIDNAGRIAYVNHEAMRLFNWLGKPHLIGSSFPEVLRRAEDHQILEIMTVGEDLHGVIELQLRDGQILALEVKTSAMRDDRGALRGVVGVFQDLTLKRKMADVETRLEKLRGLEEMAIGIAHEIRNPLASIRGAMQELSRRAFTDEDDRFLADIVLRESDRLDGILDEFMGYARMKPVAAEETDVLKLLEEVVVLLQHREDSQNVTIRIESSLDEASLPLDPDKIKQVFLNLGMNALQAMPGKGEIIFRVSHGILHKQFQEEGSRVFKRQPAIEISIEDNGPGVDPESHGQLFTPFYSTKKQGTGLGLSLAQKIIDAHNGDIAHHQPESGGACFKIRIPRSKPRDEN